METLKLYIDKICNAPNRAWTTPTLFSLILTLVLPYLFASNQTIGFVDAGIWQLLLIAFIVWILSLWLAVTALQWLLQRLELPEINLIVQLFNKLSSWQKLKSYFLFFLSLIASVISTILAIV